MRRVAPLVVLVIVAWVFGPTPARAGSGFYLSSELGANFAPELDFLGDSSDGGSVCDPFINPAFADIPGCPGPGTSWKSVFDGAEGILAGAAVGYRLWDRYPDRLWGRFRLELEYFYRESEYDRTTPILSRSGVARDKLSNEIARAEERLGSLTSHNLFGNVYFDFLNSSRFTPYVGFGVGVGFTDLDNGRIWARNSDPDQISTGAGLPNAEEIRNNLAGTASSVQTTNNDTLFGYQVLFGVDFALTESVSLGVKGRWVNFLNFRDDAGLDLLRSHAPPDDYVARRRTDDIEMFGVSVNLKYHF